MRFGETSGSEGRIATGNFTPKPPFLVSLARPEAAWFSHGLVMWAACGDYTAGAASRNLPNLAVARNWGIGSSALNADVNAFDRLHMVRG